MPQALLSGGREVNMERSMLWRGPFERITSDTSYVSGHELQVSSYIYFTSYILYHISLKQMGE